MPIQSETKDEIQVKYYLHKNQAKVWKDNSRFKVLVAGRRFGKTTLALHTLIANAFNESGSLNWYIGPTYKQAKMIAWKMLMQLIPSHLIIAKNEVELSITVDNYSQISLKGADNEDSLRGTGLSKCVLDEYSQMKPNVWEEIVRPMLIDSGGGALFIGTPKGKNHFYKMYLREKEDSDYKSFHFTSYDNPLIEATEIDKAKKESSETYFKQEYLASFEDYEGLVWPEWSEKYHVIGNIKIPKEWQKWRIIDTAVSGVTACLWMAVDMEGNVIFYREYYESNKIVSDHAQAILSLSGKEEIYATYADPSAFYKTQIDKASGKLTSLAEEYMLCSLHMYPANNTVEPGINRVAEMLRIDKEKRHPFIKGLIGAPKLFVCKGLRHTRDEMDNYKWHTSESDIRVKHEPVKKDDHTCDCVRYGVMTRPSPSEVEEKVVYNEWGEPPISKMMEEAMQGGNPQRRVWD